MKTVRKKASSNNPAAPKALIVVGPTASGKSALAVELARTFKGEIISADSRQVYSGLDIGTGKVTKREMRGIPHHLLDVASARSVFSADNFARAAHAATADIQMRGKLPIIAGGTGFYIDVLTGRITPSPVKPDPAFRKHLSQKTAAQLFTLLKKRDPARAKHMDTQSERNNKVRLIRALEIASSKLRLHQGPALAPRAKAGPLEDVLWVGIMPDLIALDLKIKKRLSERLRKGMIAEAKRLHAGGLTYKRMSELGLEYRYLALLLQGALSRSEFESQLYSAIRRYARKQIGYWKRNKEIKWFKPAQSRHIARQVMEWLQTKT